MDEQKIRYIQKLNENCASSPWFVGELVADGGKVFITNLDGAALIGETFTGVNAELIITLKNDCDEIVEALLLGKKKEHEVEILMGMVRFAIIEIGKLTKMGLQGNSQMMVEVASHGLLQGLHNRIKEIRK